MPGSSRKQLGDPVDARERGPQLVGGIGDEVFSRLAELAFGVETDLELGLALLTSNDLPIQDDDEQREDGGQQEARHVAVGGSRPVRAVDRLELDLALGEEQERQDPRRRTAVRIRTSCCAAEGVPGFERAENRLRDGGVVDRGCLVPTSAPSRSRSAMPISSCSRAAAASSIDCSTGLGEVAAELPVQTRQVNGEARAGTAPRWRPDRCRRLDGGTAHSR